MFTNSTTADFLALNICVDALLGTYQYNDYAATLKNTRQGLKDK